MNNKIGKEFSVKLDVKKVNLLKTDISVQTFDTVYLNIEIIENGLPKDISNCEIEIYGLRNTSGTKIEQKFIEGITVVDSKQGEINVKLKDSFVKYSDRISVSTLIKDEDEKVYIQPFLFTVTNSLSNSIVEEALNDIVSLEELNKMVIELNKLIVETGENEGNRCSEENARLTNETNRVSSEKARNDKEVDRIIQENIRATEEVKRLSSEKLRVELYENLKILKTSLETSESARISNENLRISAENNRISNENNRINNDDLYKQNERLRVVAEQDRSYFESTRINSENDRLRAENKRLDSEILRNNNEKYRKDNEAQRIIEENRRCANDSIRDAKLADMQRQIDELKKSR